MPKAEQILRSAYGAFNARDLEAALELISPDGPSEVPSEQ
jgi:hypothetical protein